jgi:hypothetical protein
MWALVETSAARVELVPGTYAMKSPAGGGPMTITVESDSARISGLGAEAAKQAVVIGAGQYGRVVVGEPAVRDTSGAGYPKVK